MLASYTDAQSFFNMTENDSGGKKIRIKRDSAILVSAMLVVHHSLRIIQDMEMVLTDQFEMHYFICEWLFHFMNF